MKPLLTQKQENFCLNYIKTSNATESAINAGYSIKTAQVIGSENLSKPMIIKRISELREPSVNSTKMQLAEREERLSEIARANILEFKGDSEIIADVKFGDNIRAIQELNKMDNIYSQPPIQGDIVQTFVFVLPDGTKAYPKQLKERNDATE